MSTLRADIHKYFCKMSQIKFEGLEEVLDSFDSLIDANGIKNALGQSCAIVERAAKQKAPKGTGELRNAIKSRVDEQEGEIVGVVYSTLLYAPYVEYGTGLFAENGNGRKDVPWVYKDDKGEWHSTSGMPPAPYMRPALDENRETILRLLKGGNN